MEPQAELPKYKCHKEVWALKIEKITLAEDGSGMIYPKEKIYAAFAVDSEYVKKHKPEAGGYYVLYDGGYTSFSPAKAFEEGYSLKR